MQREHRQVMQVVREHYQRPNKVPIATVSHACFEHEKVVVFAGDLPVRMVPSHSAWRWSQSGPSVKAKEDIQCEMIKLCSRRRSNGSGNVPTFKLWVIKVHPSLPQPQVTITWCEKGYLPGEYSPEQEESAPPAPPTYTPRALPDWGPYITHTLLFNTPPSPTPQHVLQRTQ
jgi:hypothetical protein